MSLTFEDFVRSCDPEAHAAADAWREFYRDVFPSIVAYMKAQRIADPEGAAIDALRRAVDRAVSLDLRGESLRSWTFVFIHHALIRARRADPLAPAQPLGGAFDLLDDLTTPERDVVLLRVIGGLSVDGVAQAMRTRRRRIEALQCRAIDVIRERVTDGYRSGAAHTTLHEADVLLSGSVPQGPGLVSIALLLHGLRDEAWQELPLWLEDQHVATLADNGAGRRA